MRDCVTVVTGAGGGIGRAAVARLVDAGHTVAAVHRTERSASAHLEILGRKASRVRPVVADVRDRAGLARALQPVGPVGAVVANAGICRQARMDRPEAYDVWREVLACNLDGVYHTLSAALPLMIDGGRMVVVSSGLGKTGRAGYAAYAASKHGVLGMMKCLARELAPRRITVNAVCPGWVDTAMARADLEATAAGAGSTADQVLERALDSIPLGRFVRPEEVAALIAWLCSDEADAVTGQAFNISCGELAA